jgi:hypothetical protein
MLSTPSASRANRSIGALFFIAFGAAWLALWAYAEFKPPWLEFAAIALGAVALSWHALGVYRDNKPALAALQGTPQEKRRSRWFNIINAGQWLVVFALASVLNRAGLGQFILPMVIAVVGLHLLPLARLFGYAPHYVTGTLLTVWPLVYTATVGPGSSLGPLGAGIVLWCSAAWALRPPAEHASGQTRGRA